MSRRIRRVNDSKINTSRGFSLLELMIVVAIIVIVAGLSIPNLVSAARRSRLRSVGSDFGSLLQQARMRAIQDDRFYSVYCQRDVGCSNVSSNPSYAFVDIYPQNVNGASGSGGTTINPPDPLVALSPEVTEQPQSAAPATSNLLQQFLGSNLSNVIPLDGSVAANPVTFGPQGLPCVSIPVTGGSVCNSRGGPVAYWVFFQHSVTQDWEAVTVTPAGHLQKWTYSSGAWSKL